MNDPKNTGTQKEIKEQGEFFCLFWTKKEKNNCRYLSEACFTTFLEI